MGICVIFLIGVGCGADMNSTQARVPLFAAYPKFSEKIKHVSLGNFSTPVVHLQHLGEHIGFDHLYMKLDSESGGCDPVSGEQLFGGNKVRKLEFALPHATDAVIVMGYAGSNFTTAAAAYCKQLGLECYCVLMPQLPTSYLRRNLLLMQRYGAHIDYVESGAARKYRVQELAEQLVAAGKTPYILPPGGSNVYGAIGFVNAAFELKEQIDAGLLPRAPDVIYVPVGSCGTFAGLVVGLRAAGITSKVIPVCVEQDEYPYEHEQAIRDLMQKTEEYLHAMDYSFSSDIPLSYEPLLFDFVGAGYAATNQAVHQAIELLFATENIKLDATYAGKTFAAMLAHASDHIDPEQTELPVILFWDTFWGGERSELIAEQDYMTLPMALHPYFTCPLQDHEAGL